MNGRIYDPTLGRFLQADPHIQAPTNSQNYNRYSYVLNNPLSYTDPTGYFFKKLFKAIGGNKFLSTIISIGLNFIPGCQAWCSAAFNAAVTYAVTGSLKGALIGAFVGAISPGGFSPGAFLARGVLGGLASTAQGGKFGHGFIAAGAGGAANGIGNVGLRVIASAVIGGTVSKITGGKFANGATSAAFATLVTAAANGDFRSKKYHALSQKRGPYENESEMGVAADNPEAVFEEAMSALEGNPYVKNLDDISFENKMAIGVMDENGDLSTWKTFDSFEDANSFAAINPETKAWLGGVSNGETALIFRNATYAKPNFRFHNRSFIPESLTHVENAARVIVHEGMHNRGVPHGFRLYHAEYSAVKGVRNGKW